MSSKPRKKKKHNIKKRINNSSAAIVKQHNLAVIYSYNDRQLSSIINIKHGHKVTPTELLIQTITDVPYIWTIFIAGLCEDADGKRYMKSEEIQANERYRQYELADYLSDRHSDLLKSCNHKHLVNAMWLACPYKYSFTDEQVFKIFEANNGWDELVV